MKKGAYNFNDVKVMINGVEVTGVKGISYVSKENEKRKKGALKNLEPNISTVTKLFCLALIMFFSISIKAQDYTPVTGDEVIKSNYLTNRSADSALNHLSKYLAKYGSFVELSNKKTGSVQHLEFVSSNQGDAARSNKLKVAALVKDGVIQEIEINGFIGHVFNLFKGYWQTDFNTVIEKPTTLFRKYGDEYLVFRSYGGTSNFARILITAKPKEIASK